MNRISKGVIKPDTESEKTIKRMMPFDPRIKPQTAGGTICPTCGGSHRNGKACPEARVIKSNTLEGLKQYMSYRDEISKAGFMSRLLGKIGIGKKPAPMPATPKASSDKQAAKPRGFKPTPASPRLPSGSSTSPKPSSVAGERTGAQGRAKTFIPTKPKAPLKSSILPQGSPAPTDKAPVSSYSQTSSYKPPSMGQAVAIGQQKDSTKVQQQAASIKAAKQAASIKAAKQAANSAEVGKRSAAAKQRVSSKGAIRAQEQEAGKAKKVNDIITAAKQRATSKDQAASQKAGRRQVWDAVNSAKQRGAANSAQEQAQPAQPGAPKHFGSTGLPSSVPPSSGTPEQRGKQSVQRYAAAAQKEQSGKPKFMGSTEGLNDSPNLSSGIKGAVDMGSTAHLNDVPDMPNPRAVPAPKISDEAFAARQYAKLRLNTPINTGKVVVGGQHGTPDNTKGSPMNAAAPRAGQQAQTQQQPQAPQAPQADSQQASKPVASAPPQAQQQPQAPQSQTKPQQATQDQQNQAAGGDNPALTLGAGGVNPAAPRRLGKQAPAQKYDPRNPFYNKMGQPGLLHSSSTGEMGQAAGRSLFTPGGSAFVAANAATRVPGAAGNLIASGYRGLKNMGAPTQMENRMDQNYRAKNGGNIVTRPDLNQNPVEAQPQETTQDQQLRRYASARRMPANPKLMMNN